MFFFRLLFRCAFGPGLRFQMHFVFANCKYLCHPSSGFQINRSWHLLMFDIWFFLFLNTYFYTKNEISSPIITIRAWIYEYFTYEVRIEYIRRRRFLADSYNLCLFVFFEKQKILFFMKNNELIIIMMTKMLWLHSKCHHTLCDIVGNGCVVFLPYISALLFLATVTFY